MILHPNHVSRVDHLVIRTNNNNLVKKELEDFGLILASTKSSYPGTEQLFYYCNDGGLLLEIFGPDEKKLNEKMQKEELDYKTYLWGIAFETSNIIKTCEYFKEDIDTKIRNAIQPGRQIFTTKEISNDLSKDFQLAFLTGSKRKRDEHRCTSIPYNELTNIFHKIELLNSRLDIVNTLSTFFIRVWKNDNNLSNNNTLPSDNLLQIVYLTCNKLAPQFKNIETGVGNGLIKKAIYEAYHTCIDDNMDEINEMFKIEGELGKVAMILFKKYNTETNTSVSVLSINDVFRTFQTISTTTGKNSQALKITMIANLLQQCSNEMDAKFLIRCLEGKLRMGVADKSILMALAKSFVLISKEHQDDEDYEDVNNINIIEEIEDGEEKKEWKRKNVKLQEEINYAQSIIKSAFAKTPSFDILIPALVNESTLMENRNIHMSIDNVEKRCSIRPGIPLQPMLSRPAHNITNAINILTNQHGKSGISNIENEEEENVEAESSTITTTTTGSINNKKLQFACEYKYDGERCQLHMFTKDTSDIINVDDDDNDAKFNVQLFSRNLENTTSRFPDIVSLIKNNVNTNEWMDNNNNNNNNMKMMTKSFIMDCEIVAYDVNTNEILPFQTLSKRQRKNVVEDNISIQVLTIGFDLLYYNGESLLDKTYLERRNILESNFTNIDGKFMTSVSQHVCLEIGNNDDTDDINEVIHTSNHDDNDDAISIVQQYITDAVNNNCEGLMLKDLHSTYNPSKRSSKWLKLKNDYIDGFGDTLDLVPIGAWKGKGKRNEVYGSFLCASYNPENDQYETVCKIGTGFTDDLLKSIYDSFEVLVNDADDQHDDQEEKNEEDLQTQTNSTIPENYSFHESSSTPIPDVWFKPSVVWEIKGAELSLSPVHTSGIDLTGHEKGVALRFPRLIRERDDKNVENATTSKEVVDLYRGGR